MRENDCRTLLRLLDHSAMYIFLKVKVKHFLIEAWFHWKRNSVSKLLWCSCIMFVHYDELAYTNATLIAIAPPTGLQCPVSHFWHYIDCPLTHIHSGPMEEDLDDVYWDRARQSRPKQTVLHYVFKEDWQLLLKWHSSYGFLSRMEKAHTLTSDQGGGHKGQRAINLAMQLDIETKLVCLTSNWHWPYSWILDTTLALWSRLVTTWHVGIMVQLMTTFAFMPKHIVSWNTTSSTNLKSPTTTIHSSITPGMAQGKEQLMLHYIVLLDTLINAYHAQIQPSIIHNQLLPLQSPKSSKHSLTMWQCWHALPRLKSMYWFNLCKPSWSGGTNLSKSLEVPWTHKNTMAPCTPGPQETQYLTTFAQTLPIVPLLLSLTNSRNVYRCFNPTKVQDTLEYMSPWMAPQNLWKHICGRN